MIHSDRIQTHDRAIKRERVLAILDRHEASGVLLRSSAAINWYLDGSRTHIGIAAPPIVQVEVTRDADTVFVTSNELQRLLAEELPLEVKVVPRRWFEEPPAAQNLGESAVEQELRQARQSFLPGETARFRALARDAAAAMTDALGSSSPTMTESQLAASLARGVIERGCDPIVILVAGEERGNYRHPLPTNAALGHRAMVVLCARRAGLISNSTRWISFGPQTVAEADSESRIMFVESEMFESSRPGRPLRDVLEAARSAYPRQGFAVDEWMEHHQGGAAGYAGRDPRVAPTIADVMVLGQPLTWNPSAPGAKVEDTVLVTEGGIEPITVDPRWPTVEVNGLARPSTLEL